MLDLTDTNPTRAGLSYPSDLLAPLADPAGLRYTPDPRGLPSARAAVSGELRRGGVAVPPERIVLTSSTSEAYGFLFKLLCDPDDEVLVPVPSYPLFEHLGALDAIRVVPYPLDAHGAWGLDVDALAARITPRTRAVLVVSPNNPTGSALTAGELPAVATLCATRGLALVGDEVFADYRFDGRSGPSVLQQDRCLTFGLGGLSKSIGLPQLKLAWIGVSGPASLVDPALARLELIADTYLPVSTPVQLALPSLLVRGAVVRSAIQERVRANLSWLRTRLARTPACSLVEPAGGWSAVLRVPAIDGEDALVIGLLERHHVFVLPGTSTDFPCEAWLVLSLLVAPGVFSESVERILND